MIITIGNQKGGVGKTTIATNIAVISAINNKKTLLIDADIQGSSMDFRSLRDNNLASVHAVQIIKPTIHTDLTAFKSFSNIFIDAGGRDSDTFRSAIMACDVLLVPVTPSPYDIWSSEETFKLLAQARIYKKINAFIVLNQVIANTNISRDVQNALNDIAKEYNLNICKTLLYSRVAYKESVSQGKGLIEYAPKSKATVELQNLYQEVIV
jgi:chromosome partitioning protein